jgi:hypothetical protein
MVFGFGMGLGIFSRRTSNFAMVLSDLALGYFMGYDFLLSKG